LTKEKSKARKVWAESSFEELEKEAQKLAAASV